MIRQFATAWLSSTWGKLCPHCWGETLVLTRYRGEGVGDGYYCSLRCALDAGTCWAEWHAPERR